MADDVVPEGNEPGTEVTRRPSPGAPRRRPMPGLLGPGSDLLRAAPSVARVATLSALRMVGWTVGAAAASANYVVRRSAAGEAPAAILHDAAGEVRNFALRTLGIDPETLPTVRLGAPGPGGADRAATRGTSTRELQQRGTELLRRSNDVHVVEDTHPAFARILSEITPDEARILRFIYLEGAQPTLDIRTFRPLGIGSELVATRLSMIGEHAGVRNLDRIDQYLVNLSRLGLLEFSREPVSNPNRYQVIEAQPKTITAMKTAGRAPKLVQRSIRLTSFGEEFVRTCLPLNGRAAPANRPVPGATKI